MAARKKNDSIRSISKDFVIADSDESKKLTQNIIAETKEPSKKMKILNISQKAFNTNLVIPPHIKGSKDKSGDKNTVSPISKNTFSPKDSSALINKARQSVNSNTQILKQVDNSASINNNTSIVEEKNTKIENPASPETPIKQKMTFA